MADTANQHEYLYGEPGECEHDGDDGDQLDHPPLVPQGVLAHTGSTSLGEIWFAQLSITTQITEKGRSLTLLFCNLKAL